MSVCLGFTNPNAGNAVRGPLLATWFREAAFPSRGELNVVVTVSAEKIIVNSQRCISGVSVGALRRNSEGQAVLAVFLYALHA